MCACDIYHYPSSWEESQDFQGNILAWALAQKASPLLYENGGGHQILQF